MARKIKPPKPTPHTDLCYRCGAEGVVMDWYGNSRWRVVCLNNHRAAVDANTRRLAIIRWNKAQIKLALKDSEPL
jgi:hypothetical protein